MNSKNPKLLAMLATLTMSAACAQAAVYTEVGDAGQTLATAANTGLTANASANTINGSIGTTTDADLYILTISNTTSFTATATGGTSSVAGAGNIDVSLFLFTSTGAPVIANDDGTSYSVAVIPGGNSLLATLAPGTYYLGVSLSGNEPVNSANQSLFIVDQPTTSVRGAASGLNPTTESTFNGATFFAETGPYSISISAVPEPSSVVSMILAASVVGGVVVHRKTRAIA